MMLIAAKDFMRLKYDEEDMILVASRPALCKEWETYR